MAKHALSSDRKTHYFADGPAMASVNRTSYTEVYL